MKQTPLQKKHNGNGSTVDAAEQASESLVSGSAPMRKLSSKRGPATSSGAGLSPAQLGRS